MTDYPSLQFNLSIDGQEQTFIANPSDVYRIVAVGIKKQLGGGDIASDTSEEQKALTRVVRTAVKGALIAFGGKILDMMFQTKDHPKPSRGDDVIEWYSDMFAKVVIAQATKGKLVLRASRGEYGQNEPIIIDEIYPVTVASRIDGEQTGGAESIEESPCAECP